MKRVLVADDQAGGRELIRTILEHSGHAVWEARDGTEAVRFAREILPDLILLDLHMPMLDGFGVLQELRGNVEFDGTPIVALTATAMQGDRERALSEGFSSYISKPIGLRALRCEMERWLA
jgi:CheY-like chemotaxis protein